MFLGLFVETRMDKWLFLLNFSESQQIIPSQVLTQISGRINIHLHGESNYLDGSTLLIQPLDFLVFAEK